MCLRRCTCRFHSYSFGKNLVKWPYLTVKRNSSKMVSVASGHQRADTLKPSSQKTSQSNHTRTTALSNSMKLSHACGATQDGQVMVESSDRMWSTGEGNGKPLQSIPLLSFIVPIFPLVSLIFLRMSLVFPLLLFSSVYALIT